MGTKALPWDKSSKNETYLYKRHTAKSHTKACSLCCPYSPFKLKHKGESGRQVKDKKVVRLKGKYYRANSLVKSHWKTTHVDYSLWSLTEELGFFVLFSWRCYSTKDSVFEPLGSGEKGQHDWGSFWGMKLHGSPPATSKPLCNQRRMLFLTNFSWIDWLSCSGSVQVLNASIIHLSAKFWSCGSDLHA